MFPKHGLPETSEQASTGLTATPVLIVPDSVRGRVLAPLSAIHNLETLLRSPRVSDKTLRDMADELGRGCDELSELFATVGVDAARASLGKLAQGALCELAVCIDVLRSGDLGARTRLAMERRVEQAASDMDTAAELLELVLRTEQGAASELPFESLVLELPPLIFSVRGGRTVPVALDLAASRAVVMVNPYTLSQVVALAVARVRQKGAGEVLVRAEVHEQEARVMVQPLSDAGRTYPLLQMRALRWVPAAERVLERVCVLGRIGCEDTGSSACLFLPIATSREA